MVCRKRTFKQVIALLTLFMMMTVMSGYPASAASVERTIIFTGDYITFGQYNGQPILWRVIHSDKDGILLFAEKVLCFKTFDAPGKLSDQWDTNERIQKGSNNWEQSSLRQWLNSSDVKVQYSTHIPDKASLKNIDNNDYAEEAGFLSNFTYKERAWILPVIHKTILSDPDKFMKDGGSEPLKLG